ncbi:WcbI family polysaccharide biosynthesis putative acetyltransferase [Acidibrevibacterium fodinaquatile]|uniref:WcbI family polysaccharide biosynthesis putative acetyltransferase n=1 Tax=Acidibrevibacterium fodinaquatile TaxID=1969806 RepID=UPI000E0CFFD8|nr:WcbI family polysaccharide biosynthesis putative acetyltransferase [Acidibrevibacterium fodinaquatile]
MRRVVFVGNCQAQALTDAFNRFVAPFTGERAFHVPAFRDNDEAHRAALERADVIVELVFDFSRRSDPADLGLTAPVIAVPYVNCQFLWPYAYEAHPRSARSEFSDSGPYPIQLSDAFLNRLMREEVPEEEAAARYLDLDINQKVRLDRRLEMTLALQRQRDEKTGFAVADLMERYFREEPIFLTPYHPSRRIFLHVVERCFARLGVAEHLIARLPRLIRRSLFLQDALPVHPRLAAHFGLVWANEATRYPFWLDGDFTFAEFIGRYLRFDWCEDFARGHYHARQGQNAEAIARLRAGLGAYPEADRAWVLLSHVYTAEGALPEALAAAREAVSRNPRDGEYFAHLGNLLTNAGEVASARVAYERAVALEPEHTPWLRLLALHWERQGRRAEAGALVATLADKDPLDYELHVQRGHLLAGRGDSAGAVMAFSHALGLAPHIEGVRAARSHTLAALERWEEAIADARAALAETPENRDLRRHLGNLLRASGDAAGAEAVFREAIRADPSDPEPYRGLAAALAAQGREEAAARLSASIACAFEGAAPPDELVALAEAQALFEVKRALLLAGQALFYANDFISASAAFRALADHPKALFWLSRSEAQIGNGAAAIEAAWMAVSLAPHEAEFFGHLGHLLAAHRKMAEAERAFRHALFLEPGRKGVHGPLSHTLYALERKAEAIEVARAGLNIHPDDSEIGSLLNHLQLPEIKSMTPNNDVSFVDDVNFPNQECFEDAHINRNLYAKKIVEISMYNKIIKKSNFIDNYCKEINIVQFWDSLDPPSDVLELIAAWRASVSPGSHLLFNESSALKFILDNFPPKYAEAFEHCFHPAMKSDLFRLAYLYVNGGIYIDADDSIIAPIPNINFEKSEFICISPCIAHWGYENGEVVNYVSVNSLEYFNNKDKYKDFFCYFYNSPIIASKKKLHNKSCLD